MFIDSLENKDSLVLLEYFIDGIEYKNEKILYSIL